MNDVKAPQFLTDLVLDLRDRRLLPLMAVAAVAIVVVPFAFSHPKKSAPPPLAGAIQSPANPADLTQLKVVADNPGLRDYRKRLSDLSAHDPFVQKFTAPDLTGSQLNSPTTTVPTTSSTRTGSGSSASVSTGAAGLSPAPGGSSSTGTSVPTGGSTGLGSTTTVKTQTRYATYELNVKIARNGESHIMRHVAALDLMPSKKKPITMFVGVTPDGKKALLLVSDDVDSVFGDAKCAIGSAACQLLKVTPGRPETFVVGQQGLSYRINVLKIERMLRKKP